MSEAKKTDNDELFTTRMLFMALVVTVVIYLFLGLYMASQRSADEGPSSPTVNYVLAGIGGLMGLASLPVRRFMIGKAEKSLPSEYQPSMDAANPHESGAPAGQEDRGFFLAHFLPLAMCESAAIFGLVIAFLSGELIYLYALCGLAIAMMAFHFPKKDLYMRMSK